MEIGIIQAIQSIHVEGFWGALLDALMLIITFFGESLFLVLVLFVTYWCIDKKTGDFLVFCVYLSAGLNFTLKGIFTRPRPCFSDACKDGTIRHVKVDNILVDTDFKPTSYSFPSGHAGIGSGLYLGTATYLKKLSVTVLSVVLSVLIALSRIYLGVHYPTDVLAGLLCGTLCSVVLGSLYLKFYRYKYLFCGVVTLLFLVVSIITGSSTTYALVGVGAGYIVGNIVEEKCVKFNSNSVWWKKVLRFFVGLGSTGLVFLPFYLLCGINGACVALTMFPTIVSAVSLAPFLFKILKL